MNEELSPEEWELIKAHRLGKERLEWLRTLDDWTNPPPIEPPAPGAPPGPAETLASQAIAWMSHEIFTHWEHVEAGHLDSGNLLLAIIRLFQINQLPLPLSLPERGPPAKRKRGRQPQPAAQRARSRKIHDYIKARLTLERPRSIPYGPALTDFLDSQARAIDAAIYPTLEAPRGLLITAAATATAPLPDNDATQPREANISRPVAAYRRHRRALLIRDLAADFFTEFLCRGGILFIIVSKDSQE